MKTLVIDCGTTNTKLIFINKKTSYEYILNKGIKDIAAGFNIDKLKKMIVTTAKKNGESLNRVIIFGMGTSELGFKEIKHLVAPVSFKDLAANIVVDNELFLELNCKVYFIPGVRNRIDNLLFDSIIDNYDFMRGEETQVFGLSSNYFNNNKTNIIILSSHTKIIKFENYTIKNSFTTMSGQLFQAINDNTILAKSLGIVKDLDNFHEIYDSVKKSLDNYGFSRSLMIIRFMDTLNAYDENQRSLFLNILIVLEDLKCIKNRSDSNSYIIIGQKMRTIIFEKCIKRYLTPELDIVIINDEKEIYDLSMKGAIKLINEHSK
jgi:2-keto-3-deoxy-galactonokinase